MKTVKEFVSGAPSWIEFHVRVGDALPFKGTSDEIIEKLNSLNGEPRVCDIQAISTTEIHLRCI